MDKNYWTEFYAKQNAELKPSLFAKYVATIVGDRKKIIELGCGNGRDAIFFANENFDVTAVDQVESEIKFLKNRYAQLANIHFQCSDFSALGNEQSFDIVYSRFTLHSVSAQQEQKTLHWAYENLAPNGLFCIEVRGQKNELFQKGTPVEGEKDAYIYDNHYRRFLNFDTFCQDLQSCGFSLNFATEAPGFAPFNGTDETFIRIIAQK